jgi:hypothetical protein
MSDMPGTPPEWPPPRSWIEADLLHGDSGSLQSRIERYQYVAERFPVGEGLFAGGFPQLFAFQEMQRSYIGANYMAVVLCAQVFAEHSLAVPYVFVGADEAVTSGFSKLIDRSRQDGEITDAVAERLHVLRKMRNPYTHPAPGTKGYDGRLVPGKSPLESLKDDAEVALSTVALLIGARRSPTGSVGAAPSRSHGG